MEDRRLLAATLSTLATLTGAGTGAAPYGGVAIDAAGDLFGTTNVSGGSGLGTVYEVAAGTNALTTLATFTGAANGGGPYAGLALDAAGDLFGTTSGGGPGGYGTVFEVAAGTHALTTLAAFGGGVDGAHPYAGVTLDAAGDLFGTTENGGAKGDGTLFEIAAGTHALTTLVAFNGFGNGADPTGGLAIDAAGDLFGTTNGSGPNGVGTVFEVAAGTNALTTLAAFSGRPDGAAPYGSLAIDPAGDLFGTTEASGPGGGGTVFEITAGAQALTTLAAFGGTGSGYAPYAGVTVDAAGDLFGTTEAGGANGGGTVFEIAAGTGDLTTLVAFSSTGSSSGISPYAGLTADGAGDLFGTTKLGGSARDGTVFEVTNGGFVPFLTVTPPAAQAAAVGVAQPFALGQFAAATTAPGPYTATVNWGDGTATTVTVASPGTIPAQPHAYAAAGRDSVAVTVADAAGHTSNVGTFAVTATAPGYGTRLAFAGPPSAVVAGQAIAPAVVVDLLQADGSPATSDPSTVTLSVGSGPAGGAAIGVLSATAVNGVATFPFASLSAAGTYTLTPADGYLTPATSAAFAVAPPPRTTVAAFAGPANGATPISGLAIDPAGDLFGTTEFGGSANDGTVFEIAAGTRALTTLATFTGTANGAVPAAGVTLDAAGDLFGTTYSGGSANDGTVFEVAAGTRALTTVATFTGTANGAHSYAAPTLDAAGDLFGTTYSGGAANGGTAFEVVAGTHALTTLATFTGAANGANPASGLTFDAAGDLFGTTSAGGSANDGTVFEIVAGTRAATTLATFTGAAGGSDPYAGLAIDPAGDLFGTTVYGGGSTGGGTVFEVAAGTHALTTLAAFTGVADGVHPMAGLTIDALGDLFGTTYNFGLGYDGTVFEVAAGTHALTTLTTFTGGPDGANPRGGLIADAAGNLFGTTAYGGSSGYGTVYEYTGGGFAVPVAVAAGQTYHFPAGTGAGVTTSTVPGLAIAAGGTAVVDAAVPPAGRQLLVDSGTGLTLAGSAGAWTGTLDLFGNDLDLPGGSLATVTGQVGQGYAGGTWAGPGGIVSTAAAADPARDTALGVVQNNQGGSPLYSAANPFDGVAPGAGDVLVKYTYYGDADLNGAVDGRDYGRVDAGFARHLTGWFNGDFNYDGKVDGSDYTLIDNAFNLQRAAPSATPTAELAPPTATTVPGPSRTNGGGATSAGAATAAGHVAAGLAGLAVARPVPTPGWTPDPAPLRSSLFGQLPLYADARRDPRRLSPARADRVRCGDAR